MKKFLSLVLALVMTMSLVTISAGAKDFTDKSSIKYVEAVDVMSGVGVIDGYTTGDFKPTDTLTRGAAAKIICNMILGPTTAAALSADAAPFKDVPANHVFAGYIAYCSQLGIINGYGDGTFRPAGTVTGYQFLKMLLGALGYDGSKEGFTGGNWSVNVAKLAVSLGLDDGNDNFVGTKAMTREEACLYAFNTMLATMVEYDNNSTIIVGDVTIVDKSKAKEVTVKAAATANNFGPAADSNGNHTLQFAEKYFPKLTENSKTLDGLKGHTYSYNGQVISDWAINGSVLATVTNGTAVANLVAENNKDYIGYKVDRNAADTQDSVTLYINGVAQNGGSAYTALSSLVSALGTTYDKRGTVIEFQDADGDGKYDNVAVTKDSVAKVGANPVVTTSGAVTSVTVSGVAGLSKINANNVFGYENLAKDDYVLWHTDGTNYFLTKCETVTGKMTDTNNTNKIFIDGTEYKVSEINGVQSVANMKTESWGKASTFYLDEGGYVVKAVADEAVVDLTNTLYLVDKQNAGYSVQAKAIFADGTSAIINVTKVGTTTIDVNNQSSLVADKFYTFTKTDAGYELKVPSTAQATFTDAADAGTTNAFTGGVVSGIDDASDVGYTITKNQANFLTKYTYSSGVVTAQQNVLATSNTAFVYDTTNGYTAYTGISNVPSYFACASGDRMAYLCDANGYAIFVVAYGGLKDNSTSTVDYVFTTGAGVETYVSASESYWTFPAVVNGEITTIEATAAAGTSGLTMGDLKSVATYDGKRVATTNQAGSRILDMNGATSGIALGSIDDIVVSGYSVKFMDNGVMQGSVIVTGDTKYFLFDTTDNNSITQITVDEMDALTGGTYSIQAVKKSSTDSTVTEMFITKTGNVDVNFSVAAYDTAAPSTTYAFDEDGNGGNSGAWTSATGADDTSNVKAATSTTVTGNKSVTVTWNADPNAVVAYSTTAGGTYTNITDPVTVTVSGADVDLYFKVTNNGATCYYKVTLDQA